MAYDDEFQAARDSLVVQAVHVQRMASERGHKDEHIACSELLSALVAAQINDDIKEQG